MKREFVFTCPNCSAEITVDALVHEELLASGCVVCGGRVTQSDFSST